MIVGSMIERMSRAILRSDYTQNGIVSPMLDAIEERDWRLYACNARASLQALMTPTPGMVEAGRAAWLESASDYTRLHESISAAFSAMIRAALEEGGDG